MKNYNKYCNKNKSAWIAYCNNIRSKLMPVLSQGTTLHLVVLKDLH